MERAAAARAVTGFHAAFLSRSVSGRYMKVGKDVTVCSEIAILETNRMFGKVQIFVCSEMEIS